ncbi:MAG: DVU0772 family protein [Solidesulfovibrio sp.]
MQTQTDLSSLVIDWDMTPEDAVTLYLEWGNNSWYAEHKPVTSKNDFSTYFVINTWTGTPKMTLVRRNSEDCVDIADFELPEELAREFMDEIGFNKGVYAPTEPIKKWLQATHFN